MQDTRRKRDGSDLISQLEGYRGHARTITVSRAVRARSIRRRVQLKCFTIIGETSDRDGAEIVTVRGRREGRES